MTKDKIYFWPLPTLLTPPTWNRDYGRSKLKATAGFPTITFTTATTTTITTTVTILCLPKVLPPTLAVRVQQTAEEVVALGDALGLAWHYCIIHYSWNILWLRGFFLYFFSFPCPLYASPYCFSIVLPSSFNLPFVVAAAVSFFTSDFEHTIYFTLKKCLHAVFGKKILFFLFFYLV
jgi:hypothetical protein